jgi:hypothetical protein
VLLKMTLHALIGMHVGCEGLSSARAECLVHFARLCGCVATGWWLPPWCRYEQLAACSGSGNMQHTEWCCRQVLVDAVAGQLSLHWSNPRQMGPLRGGGGAPPPPCGVYAVWSPLPHAGSHEVKHVQRIVIELKFMIRIWSRCCIKYVCEEVTPPWVTPTDTTGRFHRTIAGRSRCVAT